MTGRLLLLGHLLGVVLFYGNLLMAWALYVESRRVSHATLHAQLFRVMNRVDRWLTPVSVGLILTTGLISARALRLPLLSTAWIFWSLIAFGASGLVFVARLVRIQRDLERAALRGAAGEPWAPDAFRAATGRWAAWAGMGTALALIPLVLMVLRVGSRRG